MKKAVLKKHLPSELSALEPALGYKFSRPELFEQALTHSSHANELESADGGTERRLDNEQLEFLGDSILGFVTSRALFDAFPNYSEGQLSKARAHLVSAKHLVKVAKAIALGEFLRLGRGEERSGGRSKSALLVDALEAVISAIYLDGGLEPARRFILKHIVNPEMAFLRNDPGMEQSDQKSALQEFLQATGSPHPAYHLVQEEGPDHKKTFTVELRVNGNALGDSGKMFVSRAQGSTKKKAEQKAAQEALEFLKQQSEKKLGPAL
ncbi:MAG: RNAse [Acidobacteriales bacterium]|nr:RNAse [Terriglobales bacterium]